MTIFPQLSDTYYVDNDHDILKLMDYTYAKNIQINQSFWSEADIDSRFKAGDQTLWNDVYGNLPAFRNRQFNFNRIRRIINMISGYQRQHRKSTVCTPVESSSQQTSDQFTKLLFQVNTHGQVLETVSDAFEGAITTGMNLLSVWMDYRNDPVNGCSAGASGFGCLNFTGFGTVTQVGPGALGYARIMQLLVRVQF